MIEVPMELDVVVSLRRRYVSAVDVREEGGRGDHGELQPLLPRAPVPRVLGMGVPLLVGRVKGLHVDLWGAVRVGNRVVGVVVASVLVVHDVEARGLPSTSTSRTGAGARRY